MSHVFAEPENIKIKLIIRRPQEGKTFILIEDIVNRHDDTLHIIFTMNTIKSNQQLFGRLSQRMGSDKLMIFNSKPESVGESGCLHATNVGDILVKIKQISCLVLCANQTRIRRDIPKLLEILMQLSNPRNICIHIDEAHIYIPENRSQILDMYNMNHVVEIIGYSASPEKIWNPFHPVFGNIYIVDVESERNIISSPKYFSVDRTIFYPSELSNEDIIRSANLPYEIPVRVMNISPNPPANSKWYSTSAPFNMGNEYLFLCYIKVTLSSLEIDPDKFSYHFIPAYKRCVTHYMVAELILESQPNSNVIVFNGQRPGLYMKDSVGRTHIKNFPAKEVNLTEPSEQIEWLIRENRNRPTFVTGFTCVGMSVTLINEKLGNFDNVIISHPHLDKNIMYQLCRFLFNYSAWSQESIATIKDTKFYSMNSISRDKCIAYEIMVNNCTANLAGDFCTRQEFTGEVNPNLEIIHKKKENKKERDAVLTQLGTKTISRNWIRYNVYDNNDEAKWAEVESQYLDFHKKTLTGKSKPAMNADGYYHCSLTKKLGVVRNTDIKKQKANDGWNSLIDLSNSKTYARVFVGYDEDLDKSDYNIWMKQIELEDSEEVTQLLQRHKDLRRQFKKLNSQLKGNSDVESESSDSENNSTESDDDESIV